MNPDLAEPGAQDSLAGQRSRIAAGGPGIRRVRVRREGDTEGRDNEEVGEKQRQRQDRQCIDRYTCPFCVSHPLNHSIDLSV